MTMSQVIDERPIFNSAINFEVRRIEKLNFFELIEAKNFYFEKFNDITAIKNEIDPKEFLRLEQYYLTLVMKCCFRQLNIYDESRLHNIHREDWL